MAEDPLVDAVDAAAGEDDDRLSIGRRLAGAIKQPSYMPSRGGAPDAEPAPEVRQQFDPNALPESIRPRTVTPPSEVPQPPSGANNPNLVNLARQQAAVSTPINPMDPATGKIQQKYRMGLGQRILGGVSAALQGFAGQKYSGPYLGPGATNWRYGREEATRQGALEGVNTQIKTQEQLDSENEKLYRDALKQSYDAQVGEARLTTAGAQKETADVRQQLAGANEELLEARKNKLDQRPEDAIGPVAKERTALADKMGLKGSARSDYILTGKLPKEFTDPNSKRGSKYDFDKIERDKKKDMEDAEKRANAAIAKLGKPPGALDPDFKDYIANPRGWQESKKQEIYATLEKEKAQAQSAYEARIQEKGGGIASQNAPRTAPAKSNAPKTPPKQGDTIHVDGKPFMVTGINPKTKKPQGYFIQ